MKILQGLNRFKNYWIFKMAIKNLKKKSKYQLVNSIIKKKEL